MIVTATLPWFRKAALALAAAVVLSGCIYDPAYRGGYRDHDDWRRHEGHEHEWREHHQDYYDNH